MTYDLIVPSSSRPHLLGPVLRSIFAHVDVLPERLILHDDAAFTDDAEARLAAVQDAIRLYTPDDVAVVFGHDDPVLNHGLTLGWLLDRVKTEFCLYSQDDHVVIRPLPIRKCLEIMATHGLHHVRFNKRATMEFKGTWQKIPVDFDGTVLSISDHWYFQTSLWRTDRIRPVVRWWCTERRDSFNEGCEAKVNHAFNRRIPEFTHARILPDLCPQEALCMDQETRRQYQRTFIWGPPGEPQFIAHIGDHPSDWALYRARGGVGIRDTQG